MQLQETLPPALRAALLQPGAAPFRDAAGVRALVKLGARDGEAAVRQLPEGDPPAAAQGSALDRAFLVRWEGLEGPGSKCSTQGCAHAGPAAAQLGLHGR